jgi:hypothetical protein
MTNFDLPTNYIDDPEALLKRTRAKLKKSSSFRVRGQPYKKELNTKI